MTNVRDPYRTWVLDTTGIISKTPVRIRRVVWHVNNDGDQCSFYEWFESDTPTVEQVGATMATVTGQTMTSTGNFTTATINPGQVIKISKTSSTNNEDTFLIATNADANTITVASAQDPTEETAKTYSWNIYEARQVFYSMSKGADYMEVVADFSGERAGRFFQNLALGTLSGGTVYIDIA